MPASKPTLLVTRNDTRADRQQRTAAESAMTPRTQLKLTIPTRLKGHAQAAATWKRIVGLYAEIDGVIATSFDEDLLIKYCLLEEEVIELAQMRKTIQKDWETNQKAAKKIKPKTETLKDWVQMWNIVNALFQRFQGMDARLDGKRKLLLALSQSLYLTPRSRAGVAPPEKEPEKPKSEMDNLLD
jgi:phage terminase small subunit